MKKNASELLVLVSIAAVTATAGGVIGGAISRVSAARTTKRAPQSKGPVLLPATPETVIGTRTDFAGHPGSPYTLVEFMDYECPPCKRAHLRIRDLLPRYKGKLRLTVRNLPLDIHKHAFAAAVAAEAARKQGRFWSVHDELLNRFTLDDEQIQSILRAQKVDATPVSRAKRLHGEDGCAGRHENGAGAQPDWYPKFYSLLSRWSRTSAWLTRTSE